MEGLTSLAATVVRNAPSLLLSLSSLGPDGKQQPVVVWLGKLERRILEQLSVSEEWKHAHDAARAEGKGRGRLHPALVHMVQYHADAHWCMSIGIVISKLHAQLWGRSA